MQKFKFTHGNVRGHNEANSTEDITVIKGEQKIVGCAFLRVMTAELLLISTYVVINFR